MYDSKSMNLYDSTSLNHHICKSMLTDRLVQILDFGDVSTDRQVLSRVTRKVLSNSKHTLLCLCGHNVLARIKPNTIENTAVFAQVAGGAKPPRNDSFFAMSKG